MAIPGPAYKAAPTPVNTKIPVPITLPMPKKTKSNAVKLRTNPDFSASCAKCAMSFFRNRPGDLRRYGHPGALLGHPLAVAPRRNDAGAGRHRPLQGFALL